MAVQTTLPNVDVVKVKNMKEYILSPFVFYYHRNNCLYLYNAKNGLKTKIFNKNYINLIINNNRIFNVPDELLKYEIFIDTKEDAFEKEIDLINSNIVENKEILRLTILPTRNCNFLCKYCYEVKKDTLMSKETQDKLINATKKYIIFNKTIKTLHLEWFGGEPLLAYNEIIYISQNLKEFCDERKIIFFMSMTTNGSLLTIEKFRKLYDLNLKNYQITIDGFSNTHNILRPFKDELKKDSFDIIISNLDEIKKENYDYNITIRMNYYLDMIDDIDGFLDFIIDRYDDRFVLYPFRINPPSNSFSLKFEPVDEKQEKFVLKYFFSKLREKNKQIESFFAYFRPYGAVCYGRLNYALVIDVDGTIRKCTEYLEDNEFNNLGNIDNGYFDIDLTKMKLWTISPLLTKKTKCFSCKNLPNCCGGTCPIKWIYNNEVCCPKFYEVEETALETYFLYGEKTNESNKK